MQKSRNNSDLNTNQNQKMQVNVSHNDNLSKNNEIIKNHNENESLNDKLKKTNQIFNKTIRSTSPISMLEIQKQNLSKKQMKELKIKQEKEALKAKYAQDVYNKKQNPLSKNKISPTTNNNDINNPNTKSKKSPDIINNNHIINNNQITNNNVIITDKLPQQLLEANESNY